MVNTETMIILGTTLAMIGVLIGVLSVGLTKKAGGARYAGLIGAVIMVLIGVIMLYYNAFGGSSIDLTGNATAFLGGVVA